MKARSFYTSLLILILVLALALWWSLRLRRFPVRHVKVASSFVHVHKAQFKGMILPLVQQGFFSVSLHQLRRTLEAVPWIARVSIWRVWPDVVVVHAWEHAAVAVWNQKELLDAQGVIFRPKVLPSVAMLRLDGPEGQANWMLMQSQTLQRCLDPVSLHLDALVLNARGDWALHLQNGLTVLVPGTHTVQRLTDFVVAYPQIKVRQAHMRRVDLRYPNGFAVELR